MIDTLTGPGALPLSVQLKGLADLEPRYQPKLTGLRVIEGSSDNGLRMTVRLREFEVKDLLSLTRFFGFSSDTFSLSVSLLDRFLSTMKIQPKHLSCVGLCCFGLAARACEEERAAPGAAELIRISQKRFTVADMMRMEKIILEKLLWKVKAPTALRFLRVYHALAQEQLDADSKAVLSMERLEARLKVCHCSFVFSKVKPSLLALALLSLEVQEEHDQQLVPRLSDALQSLQQLMNVRDGDLACVTELVSRCLEDYSTTKSARPSSHRMRWVISGRTARMLKHSYYKIAHLPTIPESAC